jgi:hypothetical protein
VCSAAELKMRLAGCINRLTSMRIELMESIQWQFVSYTDHGMGS